MLKWYVGFCKIISVQIWIFENLKFDFELLLWKLSDKKMRLSEFQVQILQEILDNFTILNDFINLEIILIDMDSFKCVVQ